MSLTLLAEDGTTIMEIAEAPVTYEITENSCYPACVQAHLEGRTL